MLKILLKKQMAEVFRSYFYDAKKNKARSKAAVAAYIVLFVVIMLGVMGGMFTLLALSMSAPMAAAGMDWLYFALMGLLAILLGSFGSVFNTYSGLYLAKDNDLLLSMPIPVNAIMGARLLSVYLLGLMYSGVVILPAVIVYWFTVSASLGVIAGSILLLLLISIFVLTLSCALGWVVAKISLKLKNKSFITVVISLAFFAIYYFFCFRAQTIISDFVANAVTYGEKIKGAAYPIYLFGCVALGNGKAMAVVTAVVLALFGVMWLLLGRSFLKIATSSGKTERRMYRETRTQRKSIGAALLGKEFARFLSSPNYMLNCGLGVLLLPISGIVLLVKGRDLMPMLAMAFDNQPGSAAVLLCTAVCVVASMNDMAAPSISLEGKNLWLLQLLPVKPWQALRAKLSVQLLLTSIPALFASACAAIAGGLSAVETLLTLLVPQAVILMMALLNLTVGLKMPNLTWTSEIVPIKQSASVMIGLLGGMIYGILPIAGFLMFGHRMGANAYMACFMAFTLAISAGLYVWLKKKGGAAFAAL